METMQDSGGLYVDGSKGSVASGLPISKTVNQLKIVESGNESGKVLTATKSEMDPYKELELYLAKVNVSFPREFLYAISFYKVELYFVKEFYFIKKYSICGQLRNLHTSIEFCVSNLSVKTKNVLYYNIIYTRKHKSM